MVNKSYFEIWISKKRRGTIEEFLKAYPKTKSQSHMNNLNHYITKLICNNKIRQRANDEFEWIDNGYKVKK